MEIGFHYYNSVHNKVYVSEFEAKTSIIAPPNSVVKNNYCTVTSAPFVVNFFSYLLNILITIWGFRSFRSF